MVDITTIINTAVSAATGAGIVLSDGWQAVIGDRIAHYRLSNAVKLQGKVQALLNESGLKLNAARVPDRYAFAWFEEATKQDEDDIQDIFAKLLAEAATGNNEALDRRVLEIVTRLTPVDAAVFNALYGSVDWKAWRQWPTRKHQWSGWHVEQMAEPVAGKDWKKSVEHLISQGALTETVEVERPLAMRISMAMRDDTPRTPDMKLRQAISTSALGTSLFAAICPEITGKPETDQASRL